MSASIREICQMIWADLKSPRDRWDMIWRLCVCPITAPLMYGGGAMMELARFIGYGKWEAPQ